MKTKLLQSFPGGTGDDEQKTHCLALDLLCGETHYSREEDGTIEAYTLKEARSELADIRHGIPDTDFYVTTLPTEKA